MIKTGLCSISFRKHAPREIAGWAKEAGLNGIEWGGDVHVPHGDAATAEEVGRMTRELGLATPSYGSYYRLGKSVEEGLAFEKVLDSAVRLGAKTIRIWPGTQNAEYVKSEDRKKMILEARQISELAAKAGLTVAMEWHGGTLTSTNPSAVDFLREVGHAAFETYWQPPLYQTPDYCLEGLDAVLKQVRHLHVFNWYPTSSDHSTLADGEGHWSRYLAAFSKAPLPGEHYAFLEHVHGESHEGLLTEAKTLSAWVKKYS
ncbi:MAG: sugar phosphate isomerase/epimerase [Spirochaetia bacterium]|nr:sugar phosphate isomerase/epimerase [Spirochaetia bacterium]